MAFDQQTRNRLQRFVSDARKKLSEEFTRQLQNVYGIDPASGLVTPLENLGGVTDSTRETARILRDTLAHYLATSPSEDKSAALDRIVREQAFTVLNRLAALRMAEARGLLIESLGNGYNSKGFQLYARLAGTGLGETGDAYRFYLFSIFDEFALDLKVLFDRFSPYGRLFPREPALLDLLVLINDPEIAPLWAEDETIGWIYQYFNSKEERKKMRDESSAPRNSRELAVRNQFFTPRYVVEFLTDNTLGRIWYEMTRGETRLKDRCRYLVRRPTEIFLEPVESPPELAESADENLSQEELLKQSVYIQHRPLKDPREIRVLDPACGSMHFGLYAFDLLEVIYEEAWDWEVSQGADQWTRSVELLPLSESYADKAAFLREVPRLIVEHNIHGIDIDPRAVQIAGLSLWLRAQRAWQGQSVKAAERPQIRRSNIVCAEPMPGEESLLAEFIAKHFSESPEDRLLGQLVRRIFDEMKLAGEAGSLLKIEEEIAAAVAEAKTEWQAKPKAKQEALFAEMAKPEQQPLKFETAGITNEMFWHEAEERIYAALREYAEAAEDGGYQKRLFAEDAVRGFAFIDICRKRYDVVLMNPPFGQGCNQSVTLIKKYYKKAAFDLFSCFLERGLDVLSSQGTLGAITTSSGFYRNQIEDWRASFFLDGSLRLCADLGGHVLDGATVRTATYIRDAKPMIASSIFFRCNEAEDKIEFLHTSITSLRRGIGGERTFLIDTRNLNRLPGRPVAYWLPKQFQERISNMKRFADAGGDAQFGLSTKDDFRFLRVIWEVPPSKVGYSKRWNLTSKGGVYSPFYYDIHLVIHHEQDFKVLEQAILSKYPYLGDNANWVLHRENNYYAPGITFQRRTNKAFAPRVLPEGCLFTDNGPSAFWNTYPLTTFLGLFNSSAIRLLAAVGNGAFEAEGGGGANSYEVGIIKNIVVPDLPSDVVLGVAQLAIQAVGIKQKHDSFHPETRVFVAPAFSNFSKRLLETETLENQINQILQQIDKLVNPLYGFSESQLEKLIAAVTPHYETEINDEDDSNAEDDIVSIHNLLGWVVGCAFGRWDVRFATGEKLTPELPDPFAPLPVCPPGMLQNDQGLPAAPEDVPDSYPLRISWQGILVDDQGHAENLESRLQDALRVIWKDRAEAIESEACEILGVRSLRDYFRKPAAFFADHLKRYSKSRRQAPIYLPLSTASGSYTLWLYYHRLNDQTLYTCVVDYVEPKLRQVSETLNQLRGKASNRSSAEEKEFEQLQDLELELQEFRDELLRLAKLPWKPNLNDGVQITAAPLWKLFRLPKWQKILKETWQKLEKGDYDWAHLAMTIWPERIVPKCVKDRSLAIAHEVEELFWIEDISKWRNLRTPAEEIQEQKRRQRSIARERVKKLLTELAASDAANLNAEQVRNHLANGDWDDREVALRLYPERMAEKCWIDPTLAQRLSLELPAKRTKAAFEKFAKKLISEGCADVGQQLATALKGRDESIGEFWAELESGKQDDLEIALSLWGDRVVDKCAAEAELAERHNIRQFFWVQHPTETWRKREDPKVEVTNEVTRRRGAKAAYK